MGTGRVLAENVEWMRSPAENARGLLKFDSAPTSYAAIFQLSAWGVLPVVHTFGMKFPIDIALCDASREIRMLRKNVVPNKLVIPWAYLLGGCRYLVEFSRAETSDLKAGDRLDWGGS